MEKEFVPYEQSLELKELGFDEECFAWYAETKNLQISPDVYKKWTSKPCNNSNIIIVFNSDCVTAPLYQQAFRWFREKYNIDSWIQPFTFKKSNGVLCLPDESYSYFIFKDGVWVDDKVDFLEPEEAELECLIQLIEIVKNK
jgi:hypothetical protein